jgi:hypothetical protein
MFSPDSTKKMPDKFKGNAKVEDGCWILDTGCWTLHAACEFVISDIGQVSSIQYPVSSI